MIVYFAFSFCAFIVPPRAGRPLASGGEIQTLNWRQQSARKATSKRQAHKKRRKNKK
jgi:hypothetical protein